jgi:hypothetical protein
MASKSLDSSASILAPLPADRHLTTELSSKRLPIITIRCASYRKQLFYCYISMFTALLRSNGRGADYRDTALLLLRGCVLRALPNNGHCLQSHRLATGLCATILSDSMELSWKSIPISSSKQPSWATAFLTRFWEIWSSFYFFVFRNNALFHRALSSALRPPPSPRRSGICIYVPQWEGVPVTPPGTGFPFRCLLRFSTQVHNYLITVILLTYFFKHTFANIFMKYISLWNVHRS